jgi:hypothetical protein
LPTSTIFANTPKEVVTTPPTCAIIVATSSLLVEANGKIKCCS